MGTGKEGQRRVTRRKIEKLERKGTRQRETAEIEGAIKYIKNLPEVIYMFITLIKIVFELTE